MTPLAAKYDHRWRKARVQHLEQNPLCRFHAMRDEVVAATVVDHIIPHKGNVNLFWDPTNWQSLCKSCHDATKQRIEIHGYANDVGADGWPIDTMHPVNHQRASAIALKFSDNRTHEGGGVGQKSTT